MMDFNFSSRTFIFCMVGFTMSYNVQLGFVVVLKRKLKTFFSECVKGDCWENVVRKQRWFSNSRRSRAERWEKLSRRAIFPNVSGLCDGGAKEAQNFNFVQMLNRSTTVELCSYAPLLQNPCVCPAWVSFSYESRKLI